MRPAHLLSILDSEFLSTHSGYHTPVMLWGPPGVGKSQMVAQIAAHHDVPIIDIRLSQMEPTDLRGIPFRVDNLVEWAIPELLPDAKRHGPSGILFLDEITSAPPTVSASAYQLILDRRLGHYRVPDGWALFAAGNRQGDRGVTYTMPAPLANRFSHFEVETHLDDWAMWANTNAIDTRLIAFLRFKPELLFDFDPAHNPVAFPSPRSWEFAHRALQKFGNNHTLLCGVLQACVGLAAGIEFHAFVRKMDQMPDINAILAGESVAMPREVDLQYAVAAALVGRAFSVRGTAAAASVYGRVLDYAGRFPDREIGVMLVWDLFRALHPKTDELISVPQFGQWSRLVVDIMTDAPQRTTGATTRARR
ncbi:AAA domain-containing protein [Gammaproteobacteria bacterium]